MSWSKKYTLKCPKVLPAALMLLFIPLVFEPAFAKRSDLNTKIDSLNRRLLTASADTEKVKSLTLLSYYYDSEGDFGEAIRKAQDGIDLLNSIAGLPHDSKRYLFLYSHALSMISDAYRNQGNYPRSLEYIFECLKIDERLGNKQFIADDITSIAMVYRIQANYSQALEYHRKALKLFEEINDKKGIAGSHNNLGLIYRNQGKFAQALGEYFISLRIKQEIGHKSGIATTLNNIANVYALQADAVNSEQEKSDCYDKALEKHYASLEIRKTLGEKQGIAMSYLNIGEILWKKSKLSITARKQELLKRSEQFLKDALSISKSIGEKTEIEEAYRGMSELYRSMGKSEEAFTCYKLHILFRDSLLNEANVRKQTQMEMQYMFDKKQAADSISHAEQVNREEIKHRQEIKQQRIYTFGGAIAFLLMLSIVILSLRANRQKQKANEIISFQKQLVEEKQKEILDSIYYARRIQRSLLPGEKYIDKKLREHLH